jgi:thiamine biosynthesis lipoprotein
VDGRRAFVEQIMGLPVSVHVRGPDATGDAAERAVAAVFASLRHADRLFSTYRPESQVSRVRRGELAADGWDPLLRTVVALCERARADTDGFFDARVATPDFDPSGLVKGWAVERAAGALAALPGLDFCVNAGGDVVTRGRWRVGVEDPDRPDRLIVSVDVTGGAVATSGSAHRGAHIVNPFTGSPATGLRAVTVIGPSLTWADVYATAAVARGPEAVLWLDGLPGYEALLVTPDGGLFATRGWPSVANAS